MTTPVLVVDRATKRYDGHTAVDALTLTVPPGVIFGLLGPNGAGKTTTIRMIMDIIVPDSGRIGLFDGAGSARDLAHRIGFLPEERGLYQKMRVLDVLLFLAEMRGMDRRAARARALEWLERLGLADRRMSKVSELSKGNQQKVQFASALLHDPDLLVLDEPFSGLDPINADVMRQTVLDLRGRGKTILFSTQIMEHAEKLCDHICIIAKGKKLVDDSLTHVKESYGGRHLIVAFDGSKGEADSVFADRRLVAGLQNFGAYAEVELAQGSDAQEVLKSLVSSGARLSRFELAAPSLHTIFVGLVGPDAAEAKAATHA